MQGISLMKTFKLVSLFASRDLTVFTGCWWRHVNDSFLKDNNTLMWHIYKILFSIIFLSTLSLAFTITCTFEEFH